MRAIVFLVLNLFGYTLMWYMCQRFHWNFTNALLGYIIGMLAAMQGRE